MSESLSIREALEQGHTVRLVNNAGSRTTYKLVKGRLMWLEIDKKWYNSLKTLTIEHLEGDYVGAEIL